MANAPCTLSWLYHGDALDCRDVTISVSYDETTINSAQFINEIPEGSQTVDMPDYDVISSYGQNYLVTVSCVQMTEIADQKTVTVSSTLAPMPAPSRAPSA